MITQSAVYARITDTLGGISGLGGRVYLQRTPEQLDTDAWDRVLPYVIVGLRAPHAVADEAVAGGQVLDARRFRIQTQCVAADPWVVMDLSDAVTEALTGLRIGTGGTLRHAVEDEPSEPYIEDTTVTPSRPFVPLVWQITTQ